MDIFVLLQLILISFGATSAMTWFSYVMSRNFRELYKEPVLLSSVLSELHFNISIQSKKNMGWLFHYIVGFFFVFAYHIIWAKDILPVSIFSGLLLGVISGVIGIISWMIIFKLTHYQPSINFTGYFAQLFFAHMIFAIVATLLYYVTLIIFLLTKAYITT
ncbi:hypothetical protein BD847_3260 [Flavobacterium cutihirudinis]|uniref:Uncharacterized protein n=1 Tax=Flavobacterium cutihirudinis TaxID=1265740 RepID=A0A3D9FS69_9FLAO|nr:hypothetical protein [Flavobacterium cutihirudinis]RED22630.1 hypothetical protein BD847_3260 [Flavobacterium cutihirudinis]